MEIKNKYGNDAKLFKCNRDKIIFYHNHSKYPFYTAKCPKCEKYICYFCSFGRQYYGESCCIKYKIIKLTKADGLIFLGKYPTQIDFGINIKNCLIFTLIPLINIAYIILTIHSIFFYRLLNKKKTPEDRYIVIITDNSYICTYFLFGFDGLGSFFLAIPLFILSIYFIIILTLISIPFTFIPMKYIFGMIYLNEIG